MNRVEIRGGLVRDAESRFAGQTFLTTFTVAVNGTRYDSEQRTQVVKTTFVSCQAWATQAEKIADLDLQRGDEVYVVGELDQYKREDRDQPSTRVTVLLIEVLRKHATRPQAPQGPQAGGDPWTR